MAPGSKPGTPTNKTNMIDPVLQSYVRQNLESGFSQSEIRDALAHVGWSTSDIDEAFHGSGATSKPAPADLPSDLTQDLAYTPGYSTQSFFSRYRRLFLTLFMVIIVLPALGAAGFLAYQKYAPKPAA